MMCIKYSRGHVNHLNFGGHQLYLYNGWSSRELST